MEKLDLKKHYKTLYQPKANVFSIVDVPILQFVSIQGQGAPEGEAYGEAVPWLYSTLYPMKFIAKKKLGKDFVVPPLEGLWWADDMDDYLTGNRENWKWQMMIATPDWVDEELFEEGLAKACTKLGTRPDSLKFAPYDEGKAVQTLHLGPYSEEGPVIAKMHDEFIPQNGLEMTGHHHEIYLSDPRRVAPEKLRTILRQPVKPKSEE